MRLPFVDLGLFVYHRVRLCHREEILLHAHGVSDGGREVRLVYLEIGLIE